MDRKIIYFPTPEQRAAQRPVSEAPRPQTEPTELTVTIPRSLPGPRIARY